MQHEQSGLSIQSTDRGKSEDDRDRKREEEAGGEDKQHMKKRGEDI